MGCYLKNTGNVAQWVVTGLKAHMNKSSKSAVWNKGVTVGRKRPFTKEQVALIRAGLAAQGDLRATALFETGICTVLRSSDLLQLRVRDVMSEGQMIETFEVRQRKTNTLVEVDLSEEAIEALMVYITTSNLEAGQRLFPIGRFRHSQIVKSWARMAYADPRFYSTHSIRRTYPTFMHKETGSHEYARKMLGHTNLARTAVYLGVENEDVRAAKKKHRI